MPCVVLNGGLLEQVRSNAFSFCRRLTSQLRQFFANTPYPQAVVVGKPLPYFPAPGLIERKKRFIFF